MLECWPVNYIYVCLQFSPEPRVKLNFQNSERSKSWLASQAVCSHGNKTSAYAVE
jgi:hypothetical protein